MAKRLDDQDETWHAGRPQPWHIVLDGDPAPLPKGAQPPFFDPYLLWPNGSPEKRLQPPPNFCPCLVHGQTAGWMKTSLGTKVDLGPGHTVLDGDPPPSSPRERGTAVPLLFGPCLLWPRSPISATAELLLLKRELTFMFAICCSASVCHLSVCRLSSETPVHLYSAGWNFWQCFYAIWYLSHLPSVENFTKIVPGNPSVGGLNARGVAKYSDFGTIEGGISETVQDSDLEWSWVA